MSNTPKKISSTSIRHTNIIILWFCTLASMKLMILLINLSRALMTKMLMNVEVGGDIFLTL